jgi:hypothetical protein
MSEQTPKGFMKGIRLSHFLDNIAEWHALVQGFSEVMCPWPPRHRDMKPQLMKEIKSEHHYYMFGRALGIPGWLGVFCAVAHIIKGVIHG